MDLFDHNFYRLANLEYFLRILHTSPGHLWDMKKAVDSAEIDKSAEVRYILDGSFHSVPRLYPCKELTLLLSALRNKKLPSVSDHTVSSRIELADHEFDLLILIFIQILLISIWYQACRDKYSCLVDHDA